jgi:iron complex transport system permease protein
MPSRRLAAVPAALLLALLLLVCSWASVQIGTSGTWSFARTAHGLGAALGWVATDDELLRSIALLRLRQTLVAVAVGASLAYSGALLQGVFRNALASPAGLGLTSGAGLGASTAVRLGGGSATTLVTSQLAALAPVLVPLCAFIGAFGVAILVTMIATRGGRLSVPTLLLAGIAMNLFLGGMLAAVQALVLGDSYEVAKAVFGWSFGQLEDHPPLRVVLLIIASVVAMGVLPFVARELDLFAGGEEDAEALGVNTLRVKLLALGAASLAAASAVAVAGQIPFVGLVVPHLVRLSVSSSHRVILPLSILAGGVFLLLVDVLRRATGLTAVPTSVLLSLVGGPIFFSLILRGRKEMQTW